MHTTKQLAAAGWIVLALAPGARGSCDDDAWSRSPGSDHWALYRRIADRRPVDAPARPDFSGDWALNAGASDDPRRMADGAAQPSPSPGGAAPGALGRRGGGGMGRGSGRHRREDAGDAGGPSRGALSAIPEPAQALHVTHHAPLLSIADGSGRVRRLFTDFRGARVSALGGPRQDVSVAGWEGADLVVETMAGGGTRTETYRIDGRTGQLVISTAVRFPGAQPVAYRLVYDRRATGATGGTASHGAGATQGEAR